MKKFMFAAGFITALLFFGVIILGANSVVRVEANQMGYYDSGDHYHFNGWVEPGWYVKAPWTDAHVVQRWGLSVPQTDYSTKDGKLFTMCYSVGGDFGPNIVGDDVNNRFATMTEFYRSQLTKATQDTVERYTLDEIIHPKPVPLFTPIVRDFSNDHFNILEGVMGRLGLHMNSMGSSRPDCN